MTGFVAPRRLPRITQLVTAIFAILGGLQTLGVLRNLYEPGEVLVTAGRAGAINYFPEQELIESFRITSRLPVTQTILIKGVELRLGHHSVSRATFTPTVVNHLGPDQSESIQVSVNLPDSPGNYELVVVTETKAGWFARARAQTYSAPVRVWSPTPRVAFDGWQNESTDWATARFRLSVGYAAPGGLDCTATVTGAPPEVTTIIPKDAGAQAYQPVGVGDGEFRVVSQSWRTRPLADFTNTTIPIVVRAKGDTDWQSLSPQRFQVTCSPHVGGSADA